MKIPWNFFIALPLGLVLAIALFLGMVYTQLGVPTESSHYIDDLVRAKERIAASRTGPRLLIVGGSSTLFGINAKLIEQQTGLATVNMGTAFGLTPEYRFHRLEKLLRPGDTVLLALEYETYANSFDDESADDYVLARDPDYFRAMSLPDKLATATRIAFKRLQRGWRARSRPETVNTRSSSVYNPFSATFYPLDENGDETLNIDAYRPTPNVSKPNLDHLLPQLVDGLPTDRTAGFASVAAFLDWAGANHVTVLATFPSIIHQPVYDRPNGHQAVAMINHFYAAHAVPVIGTAQEVMLPADQFFDFMYHLNHDAALKRTERLLAELKSYLNK